MTEPEDQHAERADALEAMASAGDVSAADALESQADSRASEADYDFDRLEAEAKEVPAPDVDPFSPEALAAPSGADAEGAEQGEGEDPWAEAEAPVAPPTGDTTYQERMQARRARAATVERHTRRAHAHQFKKTMIPLLIVVGTMLFLLGGVVAAMVAGTEDDAEAGPFSLATARYLALAAFPLGVVLLFGAWLFHLDVRRSEKP